MCYKARLMKFPHIPLPSSNTFSPTEFLPPANTWIMVSNGTKTSILFTGDDPADQSHYQRLTGKECVECPQDREPVTQGDLPYTLWSFLDRMAMLCTQHGGNHWIDCGNNQCQASVTLYKKIRTQHQYWIQKIEERKTYV